MIGWYAPCVPDSHPYRVTTSTKCRINMVVSLDDWHIVTRNLWRKEINILRKIVHQVGSIYKFVYKTVTLCVPTSPDECEVFVE